MDNQDSSRPPQPNASSRIAIQTSALIKNFGRTQSLIGVDLLVERGELFGIVGPDGAGKTTLLQILSGVMPQTRGSVIVLGQEPRRARFQVGYLTQHTSIYNELSIDENLSYSAGVRNVSSALLAQRRERFLRKVDLWQFCHRLAGHLSGGMRQKLALCCALISAPEILLLDEPTTGLDPVSRREFWHLLADLTDSGTTTIIATPQFDEAELCSRVALISAGRIRQVGTPAELRSKLGLTRLEVKTDDLHGAERCLNDFWAAQKPGWPRSAAESEESEESGATGNIHVLGDRIDVLVKDGLRAQSEIETALNGRLTAPFAVLQEQPTLENVFTIKLESEGFSQPDAPSFPWSEARNKGRLETLARKKAIIAENLTRKFQNFVAVKNISLEIFHGEIYGLLGANGAGKTTTIQMLCGLLPPTTGSLEVGGESGNLNQSSKLRQMIGYMSQKFTLYDDLTAKENLNFYASAYSLSGRARQEKIEWVVSLCGLSEVERSLVGKLPRGFKQRIAFATAVMHEPEILFLDEPTAGVDPLARRQLWKVIRNLASHGTAVVVTTHFLDDAEYCNRLGLMVQGELVAQGSPSEIKKHSGKILEVSTTQVFEAFDLLSTSFDSALISVFPGRVHVQTDEANLTEEKVRSILAQAQVQVTGLRPIPSSLEDAFVTIVRQRQAAG